MTNTTRITLVVDLPDNLCGPYLQYIKEFADRHECEFQFGSGRNQTSPAADELDDGDTAH